MIISIDGAAGTGKTSVGLLTAKRLNFQFLDTGKIYRAFTLKLINNKVKSFELRIISKFLETTEIDYRYEEEIEEIILDNKNVSSLITNKSVEQNVSQISKIPEVRTKMTTLQRSIVKGKKFIVVGRDIGTVVLPHADIKIFLTASLEERTQRRLIDKKGESYQNVYESLKSRDQIDTNREVAPLKAPKGSTIIDTENLDLGEVSDKIISLIHYEPTI